MKFKLILPKLETVSGTVPNAPFASPVEISEESPVSPPKASGGWCAPLDVTCAVLYVFSFVGLGFVIYWTS